jgi:hypothetical protein
VRSRRFPAALFDPLTEELERLRTALQEGSQRDLQAERAPPDWGADVLTTYPHVSYSDGTGSITLRSINYCKVLDIGVGHAHWHEQYEGITGGELQPLRASPIIGPIDYAFLYRMVNGPVRDGDGYIDGTCNLYALVQLKSDDTIKRDPRYRDPVRDSSAKIGAGVPDAYALLYIDEQSYFTQRWRLVHPDDFRGLMFALVDDLTRNPGRYNWNSQTYWCPFRAGHIGSKSRLAVSRQVLLVNGEDDSGTPVIYSLNFSFSTMDRTWRWRKMPDGALVRYFDDQAMVRGDETIATDVLESVYPQTIRLREDMTVHIKGTHVGVTGRWYQRYLPATNLPIPLASELLPGRPGTGYAHAWKFLPELAFQRADRFSHFGVYDTVDSRTQYYLVEPFSDVDAQNLAAGGPGPWIDQGRQLHVNALKFWWAAPLRPPEIVVNVENLYVGPPPKRPPSIFNLETRLRIVKRGSRWLAMHWDKRDDDLMPFAGCPRSSN